MISISAVFFGVGVVMFLVDALAPMGLVSVGGAMQTVGAFFLFLGLRKNYLLRASKDHFASNGVLDISSAGQIILYLNRANRRKVCLVFGRYKARRIFFARIVGHDYIRET